MELACGDNATLLSGLPLRFHCTLIDPPTGCSARSNNDPAVSDGRKLEDEYTDDMSARWLWLDDNSRPDRAKGYLYKILKVYRISKCTKLHSRCKGACLKRKAIVKKHKLQR